MLLGVMVSEQTSRVILSASHHLRNPVSQPSAVSVSVYQRSGERLVGGGEGDAPRRHGE
jgi:hypothetical protein